MASSLLGSIALTALVANTNSVGVINNTETYISTNTWCNVNTAISQAGNTYRFTALGYNTTKGEGTGNFTINLKGGLGGNVADATLATVTGRREPGDPAFVSAQFYVTVRPGTYAANTCNVAVAGVPSGAGRWDDVGSANANVPLVGNSTGGGNAILGLSCSGGDGFSNIVFTTITVEQLA